MSHGEPIKTHGLVTVFYIKGTTFKSVFCILPFATANDQDYAIIHEIVHNSISR